MNRSHQVGAAAAIITPRTAGIMAGYALRDGASEGTTSELMVRVTIFDDGADPVAIVVCDLLYAPAALTAEIQDAVCRAVPVRPEHVVVAATHTHAGPSDLATAKGAAVRRHVSERSADAASRAWDGRQPADLVHGTIDVAGVSANRRVPAGAPDETLDVLVALDVRDGQPIATLMNFACHATVLGPETRSWSPDYPGAACEAVEAWIGGTATFVQGCAGDVNPVTAEATWPECERIGQVLAAATVQIVRDAQGLRRGLSTVSPSCETEFPASGRSRCRLASPAPLTIREATVRLELADEPDRATKVDAADPAVRSMRWIQDLKRCDGNLFGASDTDVVDVRVQVLRLGTDLRMATLPGEPMSASAGHLRQRASGSLLIAGYANQATGYLPMKEDFAHLGYEVGATQYRPGAAERLLDALEGLLHTDDERS